MTDREFIRRLRDILDQPTTSDFKIEQIAELLADEPKPGSTRWLDTGSGPGWTPPSDTEHWGRHDDPEAER
jgi:hypothetical protein